jgi:hypothetical protein
MCLLQATWLSSGPSSGEEGIWLEHFLWENSTRTIFLPTFFAKYDLPCENWMRPLYPLQVWSATVVSLETGYLVRCSGRRIWCKLPPLRNFWWWRTRSSLQSNCRANFSPFVASWEISQLLCNSKQLMQAKYTSKILSNIITFSCNLYLQRPSCQTFNFHPNSQQLKIQPSSHNCLVTRSHP